MDLSLKEMGEIAQRVSDNIKKADADPNLVIKYAEEREKTFKEFEKSQCSINRLMYTFSHVIRR